MAQGTESLGCHFALSRNRPHGRPQLQTAFSLETVLDEVSFIAGPPLAVMLSVLIDPHLALPVAALLLVTGVAALVSQRATEPVADGHGSPAEGMTSPLRLPTVRVLVVLMMAMGVIVGCVDIVSVALTRTLGQPALASLVLSAYALASCGAGLLFGAVTLRLPLPRQLMLGGVGVALSTLPLLLASSVLSLTAAVLLCGLFFAPTMIIAMSLVERIVPGQRLTEGLSWLLAGLNVGVALGAAAAGQVLDSARVEHGFYVATAAAVAILAVLLCLNRGVSHPVCTQSTRREKTDVA
ncbi:MULTISPECIES: MFS transporter [Klebsiella/Raoultella group]|nr:MFS transporter [Raoultella ornithinolytica]MEE3765172.1 MFS transporter [Klebsiella pneumoniae]